MSNEHANKEGGKGVHTQQSNQGDRLVNQQGVKSKNIKPNRQKGEDNPKRAGRNPQPTQPTATDTQSIGSSPKPTAAKPQKTPTDTQTTVTSPQPAAAKSQQTAADTQTTTVNPKPIGGNLQQTGDNSQQAGNNFQQAGDNPQHKDLSETKSEGIGGEGQITMKHNNSSPKENTTYRREASSHHGQENRDEGADGDVDQQVEEPEYKDSLSTKVQTYNNKRALSEAKSTHIRNRQPGIPEKTMAGQPVQNDKKERTYGIPKRTSSRFDFSDDEQYDMTEANRIEKSKSRTGMDDWTNQLRSSIINVIVTIIVCVLFMNVYPRWVQVQTAPTIDNSHAPKELMTMEEAISDLRNENKKYKTMLDDMSSNLDKANRRVDILNKTFGELEKSFKTMTESNPGKFEEIGRKIDKNSDKLSANGERIEQVNTDISNTRTYLEEKFDNKGKETIQEVSKIRREMDDKIKKKDEEMSSISERLNKIENDKKMQQYDLDKIEDMVDFLRANAFNKSVFLNLIAFLTIAVFALIIGMWIIWNRVSFDHHGNTPRHGSGTNPRMPVIEQVPNHPPLSNTICVISYGQTNESFNHTLVHKLMRQLSQPLQDTPVRGHLINTHADIANIPHCKLIFMCVEFSTRHVIIEEPGIGQGDIRRTTYDAVKKLGATLVILYTRDHESRQLGDNLRYQKDIYCVASQPELRVLDDQKCFYSVFNSFTQSQVESLETVIRKALQ